MEKAVVRNAYKLTHKTNQMHATGFEAPQSVLLDWRHNCTLMLGLLGDNGDFLHKINAWLSV